MPNSNYFSHTVTAKNFFDALDPNKTKPLYIGEFSLDVEILTLDEDEETLTVPVPWPVIKKILRAVQEQALINAGWQCSNCGNKQHILTIRDNGEVSCCPERDLAPPTPSLSVYQP